MNQLVYNFLNEIEDVNKIKEMTVEEFIKIVKSNELISEEDAKRLIDSFKEISRKKIEEDTDEDSDQRKKKYRQQHKEIELERNENKNKMEEKNRDDESMER